jgi:hypothetical protein
MHVLLRTHARLAIKPCFYFCSSCSKVLNCVQRPLLLAAGCWLLAAGAGAGAAAAGAGATSTTAAAGGGGCTAGGAAGTAGTAAAAAQICQ